MREKKRHEDKQLGRRVESHRGNKLSRQGEKLSVFFCFVLIIPCSCQPLIEIMDQARVIHLQTFQTTRKDIIMFFSQC